jgi:hypothetical protein
MSKTFYNWLNNRLDEYAINRERVLKAHRTRWAQAIAKQNNGVLPTESEHDGVARLHAPYDGYVHHWVKGDYECERTYLGGQFLPYDSPDEPMWGGTSTAGESIIGVPVDRVERFLNAPELKKAIKMLDIRAGWEYTEKGADERVRNVHLNNCPEDIRSAINNFLMGDIYKLQRLAAQKTEEEREARDLLHRQGEDVTEGRQVITGVVLAMKWQSSDWGDTLKMLVQDDRGFRVWGTVPGNIEPNREERVTFTATITQSDKDPKFGFFKRPTKAAVLDEENAEAEA